MIVRYEEISVHKNKMSSKHTSVHLPEQSQNETNTSNNHDLSKNSELLRDLLVSGTFVFSVKVVKTYPFVNCK